MQKQYFIDANDIEWVIEKVNDPDDGIYFWIHVVGDNEKYSGFVGESIGGTFEEFLEGGYLER